METLNFCPSALTDPPEPTVTSTVFVHCRLLTASNSPFNPQVLQILCCFRCLPDWLRVPCFVAADAGSLDFVHAIPLSLSSFYPFMQASLSQRLASGLRRYISSTSTPCGTVSVAALRCATASYAGCSEATANASLRRSASSRELRTCTIAERKGELPTLTKKLDAVNASQVSLSGHSSG